MSKFGFKIRRTSIITMENQSLKWSGGLLKPTKTKTKHRVAHLVPSFLGPHLQKLNFNHFKTQLLFDHFVVANQIFVLWISLADSIYRRLGWRNWRQSAETQLTTTLIAFNLTPWFPYRALSGERSLF